MFMPSLTAGLWASFSLVAWICASVNQAAYVVSHSAGERFKETWIVLVSCFKLDKRTLIALRQIVGIGVSLWAPLRLRIVSSSRSDLRLGLTAAILGLALTAPIFGACGAWVVYGAHDRIACNERGPMIVACIAVLAEESGMASISKRSLGLVASTIGACILLALPLQAQPGGGGQAAIDSDRNSPSHTRILEAHVVLQPDLSFAVTSTVRLKILRESAIRTLGQQSLSYIESLETLDVVEAYTEKPDGRKLPVDPAKILTRDAATGLNAIYLRDAKVKTLFFPDIEIGDTLVWVSKSRQVDTHFPGYFFYDVVFPRSVPIDTYRLIVDEPNSVRFRFSLRGQGLSHKIAEMDTGRRHMFDFKPTGWEADEANAVSTLDRDPRLTISTFKDWSDVGASYWAKMKDRDAVDARIQTLADEITKGIGEKRAQAEAIDAWIKKNIRYVHVFLGSAGTTPNPPLTVLSNKFGDCKDHAALMGALLKAKGIASEQVLMSTGSIYRLPDLPIPPFDHVILYLPEFDVYNDPTASFSRFGTLPEGFHDKPVLHISNAGGRLARMPPMRAEDHVSVAKTKVSIGSDGTVKGTTQQLETGIFAAYARLTASQIQEHGREKAAEMVLRNLGNPGVGVFEATAPFDFSEPYKFQGEFSLYQKLPTPLDGAHDMPIGIPIDWRLGIGLLGPRIEGRKSDFICFAGKQVEEIEVTFAPGLALPRAIRDTNIDHKIFKLQSHYAINGRTLAVRREFTVNVAGQVCGKEIEAELSVPMERVLRSLRTQMIFQGFTSSDDAAQP